MQLTSQLATWLATEYDSVPALRLQLLDAAAEAFTAYGYAAASIDAIAQKLGVTKGSVYYHYRSKVDLFFAVHRRAMIMNLKAQVPLVVNESLDPAQRLHRMAYAHASMMMDAFYYQRVTVQGVELHQSVSSTPKEREALQELVAMRDTYESLFARVIQEGIHAGEFCDLDASLATKGILGMLNWITVWYRPKAGDSTAFKERVATQLARQALSGVLKGARLA